MIGALKQLEAGRKAEDVAREVGVSKHTIYAWKAKYGGMDVSEAQLQRPEFAGECKCRWMKLRLSTLAFLRPDQEWKSLPGRALCGWFEQH